MSFNIDQFSAEINSRGGLMRTNRFQLRIPPPPILLGRQGTQGMFTQESGTHFWAQDVQMPGYQLQSGNVRRYTYGPNETRPFAPNFQQVQANFAADGAMTIWQFFDAWLQSIVPHDSDGIFAQQQSAFTGGRVYELSYKSEYATDIDIVLFNEIGDEVMKLTLYEAFPSNMNAIPLAWGEQNNYATFSVFFEYVDWNVEYFEQENFKRRTA